MSQPRPSIPDVAYSVGQLTTLAHANPQFTEALQRAIAQLKYLAELLKRTTW